MSCSWTEPERIAGEGTGDMTYTFRTNPPEADTCECGHLRCHFKVVLVDEASGKVTAEFTINDDYEAMVVCFADSAHQGGATYDCGCGIIIAFEFDLPDPVETYEVGDLWHFEQVME